MVALRAVDETLPPMVPVDDPVAYINQVRAEIEAEAATRRRLDSDLQRREREIERAWMDVAPLGAAGSQGELLLDRADRLAMIDVDAPLGKHPRDRKVKGAIRKATRWYLRYVTDQLNAFNNLMIRLVRRFDERLCELEAEVSLGSTKELLDAVPEPSPAVADAVLTVTVGNGRTAVLSCASGNIARALHEAKRPVYGIDGDALAIMAGVRDGLDLRVGDPMGHLHELDTDSLACVVLCSAVEDLSVYHSVQLIEQALRVVRSGGAILVAVRELADRDLVESELRRGRGLSVATWRHLLDRAGTSTTMVDTGDSSIRSLVVARLS